MDKSAVCRVRAEDEIGVLAGNINDLYQSLLAAIETLELEKQRVREVEQSKVDFMRAASHELNPPLTALNATLENMILGVGKYRDTEAWLPECKGMAGMIQEILEASRAGGPSAKLPPKLFGKAVSNILANAVAYTDPVSVYFDGRTLVMENAGTPIPPEALPHLFEPFYRPDYARSREDGGNGLGPYLADLLLGAMGLSYPFRPMERPAGMRFVIHL